MLTFNAALHDEQTRVLEITNDGTTAVILRLENMEQHFRSNALFLYPTEAFSILPGQRRSIAVYFKASQPGSYHLVVGIDAAPCIAQKKIELQAVCMVLDEDAMHREVFEQRMREKQIEQDAVEVMQSMLASVAEPDLKMQNLPRSFCEANRDHGLHWHPNILSELQILSQDMIRLFRRRKRNSYRWDLSVSTLKGWLGELKGIADDSMLDQLDLRLNGCIERG